MADTAKDLKATQDGLTAIIDGLAQTRSVVALAHYVSQDFGAGEQPWLFIDQALQLAHDRIEETITKMQALTRSDAVAGDRE